MGMIDRYKKPGGFVQLLTLLETCGTPKQAKFLEIIKQENPRWAMALQAKIIDLDRILKWTDTVIGEITGAMREINVAVVLKSLDPAVQQRLLGTLPHIKKRKVEALIDTLNPSPGEIATSYAQLYETTRRLTQEGIIRLDKIDPMLFVDGDIEDRLSQNKEIAGVPSLAEAVAAVSESPHPHPVDMESPHLKVVTSLDSHAWNEAADSKDLKAANQELTILRKRVADLQKENATIRQELTVARGKLEQIKKLA